MYKVQLEYSKKRDKAENCTFYVENICSAAIMVRKFYIVERAESLEILGAGGREVVIWYSR